MLVRISLSSYCILAAVLKLPAISTLYRYMQKQNIVNPQNVEYLKDKPNRIEEYKANNEFNRSFQLTGVLAVDSISFEKFGQIFPNGTISGLVQPEEFRRINQSIQLQEQLMKYFANDTIVFQPILKDFPPVIIHIEPYHGTKDGRQQIEKLNAISLLLEEQNLSVLAFATDGDSGYRTLVNSIRVDYLETAFWYGYLYKERLLAQPTIQRPPQKGKNTSVVIFDTNLLDD